MGKPLLLSYLIRKEINLIVVIELVFIQRLTVDSNLRIISDAGTS